MPNAAPVAVSPRGGPQPAKKAGLSGVVARATAKVVKGNRNFTDPISSVVEELNRRENQPPPPAPDTSWKPDPLDLAAFMAQLAEVSGGTPDPFGVHPAEWTYAKGSPAARATQAGLYAGAVAAAKTPEDLAASLGIKPEQLAPFLETAAQNRAQVDAALAEQDKQGEEAKRRVTPPARGGSTPDSIDRPQDPFDMLTPVQMTSSDLDALIASMDANSSDQQAQRLAAAKQAIMADTATAIARQGQLAEAYRAGVRAGGGVQSAPSPGESTAQGRYATAGPQSAQVAIPPEAMMDLGLDSTDVEDRILMAGQAIEQTRREEKRRQVVDRLVEQRDAAAQAEREVQAEADKAAKAQEEAARKQAEATFDEETRAQYARDLKAEVATGKTFERADNGEQIDGDEAYRQVRRMVKVGARRGDILKQVFGIDTEFLPDSGIPNEVLAIIQAATFSVGSVPDGLRKDWEAYRDAARAHRDGVS